MRKRQSETSGEETDVESVAARWAVRVAEGTLGPTDQAALDGWLDERPAHLGAFVRAQAVWADVDRVVALDAGARRIPEPMPRRRHWWPAALAASFAAVIAGGAITYDNLAGRVATGHDDVRRLVLDDGSVATLNADSVLQVRYTKDERRLYLRRGEASFSVAHNKARPFVVTAGKVSVTAVGTEFSVDRQSDDVAVMVAHGLVKVDDRSQGTERHRMLAANQQFVAAPTGSRKTDVAPTEVQRQLAWRDRLLMFEGQQLGEAAGEVSRYADMPVVIDDPTLARAEFVGVFRMGDSRAFARAAAQAFNGVVTQSDGTLHISRRQDSPSH